MPQKYKNLVRTPERLYLVKHIEEAGMSARSLSIRLGKNNTYISAFLDGKQAVLPMDVVQEVAEILQCDPRELSAGKWPFAETVPKASASESSPVNKSIISHRQYHDGEIIEIVTNRPVSDLTMKRVRRILEDLVDETPPPSPR